MWTWDSKWQWKGHTPAKIVEMTPKIETPMQDGEGTNVRRRRRREDMKEGSDTKRRRRICTKANYRQRGGGVLGS